MTRIKIKSIVQPILFMKSFVISLTFKELIDKKKKKE